MDGVALLRWIASAKPGDAAVYARGASVPREVAQVAREAAEAGFVDLVRKREGLNAWAFQVQRRSKPLPSASGRRRFHPRGSAEGTILRLITQAAKRGRACPTNLELARACGLSCAVAASYRLRKLAREGRITIEQRGPLQRRVVTLHDSGLSTAETRR